MPTLTAMRPVLREEGVKGKVSAEAGVHSASLAKAGSAALSVVALKHLLAPIKFASAQERPETLASLPS